MAQFFNRLRKKVMAANIVDTLRKRLGYPPLEKIDANKQETKNEDHSPLEKLAQAAIPAVLAGLYRFSHTEKGCYEIIGSDHGEDWFSIIYQDHKNEAVDKVAHYAMVTNNQAASHMETIADESVKLVKEIVSPQLTCDKMRQYLNSQRHNILVHLPAALKMGDILNDGGMDDRTNKMEGPVSNLMHKIENTFGGGDNPDPDAF
jgi:hypothetical protein